MRSPEVELLRLFVSHPEEMEGWTDWVSEVLFRRRVGAGGLPGSEYRSVACARRSNEPIRRRPICCSGLAVDDTEAEPHDVGLPFGPGGAGAGPCRLSTQARPADEPDSFRCWPTARGWASGSTRSNDPDYDEEAAEQLLAWLADRAGGESAMSDSAPLLSPVAGVRIERASSGCSTAGQASGAARVSTTCSTSSGTSSSHPTSYESAGPWPAARQVGRSELDESLDAIVPRGAGVIDPIRWPSRSSRSTAERRSPTREPRTGRGRRSRRGRGRTANGHHRRGRSTRTTARTGARAAGAYRAVAPREASRMSAGGSSDPVRMYLKEIGRVPLLTGAGGGRSGQEIEAGHRCRPSSWPTSRPAASIDGARPVERRRLERLVTRRRAGQVRAHPGQPAAGGVDRQAATWAEAC